jgi:transcriptional regulator of arginine metabolism
MSTFTRYDQKRRRAAIERLLRTQTIGRQTELVGRLSAQGFAATQSSVSRDLKEMGVIKQAGRYVLAARPVQEDPNDLTAVAGFIRGVQPTGSHLLVISTAIGAAQRVALTLDRMNWPEIVGTLSGDDTIFVATLNQASQRRLRQRLGDSLTKVTT